MCVLNVLSTLCPHAQICAPQYISFNVILQYCCLLTYNIITVMPFTLTYEDCLI